MSGTDMAAVVLNFLKNHANANTLRGLVQGGKDNILEAGDLTEEILNKAIDDRRIAGNMNKALALSIQDAGERETGHYLFDQFVAVRVYDRGRGYRNIRACKVELMKILRFQFDVPDAGIGLAHMETFFAGRTGHRFDRIFNIEYEAITFRCAIMRSEEIV